jgi:hypothetical protein
VSDNFKLGNVQSGRSITAPNNTLTAGDSFFYRVPFTTPDMFVGMKDSAGATKPSFRT